LVISHSHFTDLSHRTPRRTLCPHPAVVRKFAAAAPAQKKLPSFASASPLLLLRVIKTGSPLSCIVLAWFLRATLWSRASSGLDLKFYRHESRRTLPHIRQGVGVVSRQPFNIAGFEFSGHRAHSFDVAPYIEIGDRDQEMR